MDKITVSRRVFELMYNRNSSEAFQLELDQVCPAKNNLVEIHVSETVIFLEVLHDLLKNKPGRKEIYRLMVKEGLARVITDEEIRRLKRPGGGHGQFCKSLHDFTFNGSKYVFVYLHLEQGE